MSERIEYIDCLRGFTMVLVVYYHLGQYLGFASYINTLCLRFRMPLFFFISGFMLYSSRPYNEWIKKRLKNRLFNQFLPTLAMMFIYSLYANENPIDMLYSPYKCGYWFTIVLFEGFLIYLISTMCMDKIKLSKRLRLIFIFFITLTVSGILTAIGEYMNVGHSYYNLLSLQPLAMYLPFLFCGVIFKMYLPKMLNIITNKYINFLFIIIFIFFHLNQIKSFSFIITGICGIFIVFHLFRSYQNFFSKQTFIGKTLSYIGKNTLPIYFLHYFFLKIIVLKYESLAILLDHHNFLIIILGPLFALLIVFLSLITNKILQPFELLHTIMFGPPIKKEKK